MPAKDGARIASKSYPISLGESLLPLRAKPDTESGRERAVRSRVDREARHCTEPWTAQFYLDMKAQKANSVSGPVLTYVYKYFEAGNILSQNFQEIFTKHFVVF